VPPTPQNLMGEPRIVNDNQIVALAQIPPTGSSHVAHVRLDGITGCHAKRLKSPLLIATMR